MAHGACGAIRRRWRRQSSPPSALPRIQQQQAEIAASLMGLPFEEVLAEVKKTGRALARSATRVIAGEQGAQRSVVVERRVVRRFGNDKRTGT